MNLIRSCNALALLEMTSMFQSKINSFSHSKRVQKLNADAILQLGLNLGYNFMCFKHDNLS